MYLGLVSTSPIISGDPTTRPTFKGFTRVGFCLHLNPTGLSPIRSRWQHSQPDTRPVYRPIGQVPGRTEFGFAQLPTLFPVTTCTTLFFKSSTATTSPLGSKSPLSPSPPPCGSLLERHENSTGQKLHFQREYT